MEFKLFKPRNQKISKDEILLLASFGKKWCAKCSTVKPLDSFHKNQHTCIECSKISKKNWYNKNKSYGKKYKNKNKEKWREYDRIWHLRYRNENREKYNEQDRKWRSKWYKTYRQKTHVKFRHRLGMMVLRIKNGKAGRKTMSILGVKNQNEFLSLMNLKSSNKDWIKDGWELDHIWQVQWFSELSKVFPEEICSLLNHHSNLRPISKIENYKRNTLDFSPLKERDFAKYKKYLNKDILQKISDYFTAQSY